MNAHAMIEEVDSVATCARLALAESKGDPGKATEKLVARVRKDKALREAILDPLVEYACNQAVMREVRVNRGNVWVPPSPERLARMPDAERVRALANGTLLMFPLPGGKRLGEATREEVAEAARFYERQAGDMAHKARWLQLVAQSIPDGKTAGKVLSDERLRDLQTEAQKHG